MVHFLGVVDERNVSEPHLLVVRHMKVPNYQCRKNRFVCKWCLPLVNFPRAVDIDRVGELYNYIVRHAETGLPGADNSEGYCGCSYHTIGSVPLILHRSLAHRSRIHRNFHHLILYRNPNMQCHHLYMAVSVRQANIPFQRDYGISDIVRVSAANDQYTPDGKYVHTLVASCETDVIKL